MRIDIITIVPEILSGPFSHSILKRAEEKGLLEVHIHDLRNYGLGKHKQVDDYAYGGGAGMVIRVEPVFDVVESLMKEREYQEIIYTAPDGALFNQKMANQLSLLENLIILCGHYKGIDERIREHLITRTISIGQYVLSGGELAAAVIVDAVGRLIPGVLNDETSALSDSFQDDLIAPPVYTRPAEFRGWKVPEVLLSGHKARIEEWNYEQSLERTRNYKK